MANLSLITAIMCTVSLVRNCHGDITITEGPSNTSAVIGASVYLHCRFSGTQSYPYWRINGNAYSVNRLPPGHEARTNGIYIPSVTADQNNTEYLCFFSIYIGGGLFEDIESLPAYLHIFSSLPEIVTDHPTISTQNTEDTLNKSTNPTKSSEDPNNSSNPTLVVTTNSTNCTESNYTCDEKHVVDVALYAGLTACTCTSCCLCTVVCIVCCCKCKPNDSRQLENGYRLI